VTDKRGVDVGMLLSEMSAGSAFNEQKPRRAKVTSVTNWETNGIRAIFEATGEAITVEAAGAAVLFEIAVNDYIYVTRLERGKQDKWIIFQYGESSTGSNVPTTRVASLPTISSLDASDGAPTSVVSVDASGVTTIGDGTNEVEISAAGVLTLNGTAVVIDVIPLPLLVGGGTATIAAYLGAPTILFDADGETALVKASVPFTWDEATDMSLEVLAISEQDEGEFDVISFTAQVRSYFSGDAMGDAGQSIALDSATGVYQDEPIEAVGVIDYDHGSYPIRPPGATNVSVIVIELTANIGGTNEASGPIHLINWQLLFIKDKLGA